MIDGWWLFTFFCHVNSIKKVIDCSPLFHPLLSGQRFGTSSLFHCINWQESLHSTTLIVSWQGKLPFCICSGCCTTTLFACCHTFSLHIQQMLQSSSQRLELVLLPTQISIQCLATVHTLTNLFLLSQAFIEVNMVSSYMFSTKQMTLYKLALKALRWAGSLNQSVLHIQDIIKSRMFWLFQVAFSLIHAFHYFFNIL